MGSINNFNRINDSIKQISKGVYDNIKPVSIMFGEVVEESPLSILVEQKLKLGENQLILSRNVRDYKTEISFDNPDIKNVIKTSSYPKDENISSNTYQRFTQPIKNEVTIYNGLKVGENVILLRLEGGQKFLVIDRR